MVHTCAMRDIALVCLCLESDGGRWSLHRFAVLPLDIEHVRPEP